MGSYGTISFNNIELYGAKNMVNYHMLNIFSSKDYMETLLKSDDGETICEKKFVTTCAIAKKRLDIIGYSVKRILDEFQRNMEFLKSDYDDYPSELHEILSEFYDYIEDRPKYNLIQNMTIDNFNNAIKCFLKDSTVKKPTGNIILDYIIDYAKDQYGIGFPVRDPLGEVRIILENMSDYDKVEYDLTEIIDNGYEGLEDILSFWNENRIDLISNKTIILTEGKTDIYVLKKSLKLLYPQYSNLYNFFDFNYIKSPGSTNNLVNLVKGFVNAGIKNRIIALFDNDTAAYEAISTLDKDKLTANIKIMHLPDLEWAKNYPTLGPTGKMNTDINKLACSIELFLGKNLLKENNEYIPIQWKGYSSKLKRYQGEILYKKEIYDAFCNIIKKIEQERIENVEHDWEQLKYLWETIFTAYND